MCCHSVRLWYDTPDNAIGYAMPSSRSHDALIRVYDDAGSVTGRTMRKGPFKESAARLPPFQWIFRFLNTE
jgi:hypothetical protein